MKPANQPLHLTARKLAEKLIESIDAAPSGKLSVAWRKEIRRRRREMDEGAVQLRDAKAVFANAYTALK